MYFFENLFYKFVSFLSERSMVSTILDFYSKKRKILVVNDKNVYMFLSDLIAVNILPFIGSNNISNPDFDKTFPYIQ